MDRATVFLSSTFRDTRLQREFAETICKRMGFDVHRLPENADPGGLDQEFIAKLQKSHVLILISTGPSDNVDIEIENADEYGIPIISLAQRELLASGAGSDITETAMRRRGMTPRFQTPFETLADLETAIETGLSKLIREKMASGQSIKKFDAHAYERATQATGSATYRLGMVQETGTLLLGPQKGRDWVEGPFLRALQRAMEKVADRKRKLKILYLVDAVLTRRAMEEERDLYPSLDLAHAWLRKNRARLERSRSIELRAVDSPVTASFIHDTSLEIATVLQSNRYYVWLDEAGPAANGLWEVLRSLGGRPLWDLID